jgi:hypothetical protein
MRPRQLTAGSGRPRMPTLAELQDALRAALLDGDARAAAASIIADRLAPAARLAIYGHHVRSSLTAVLQDTFPVVRRLVGEGFFGYAAHRFIRRGPPAGPCLFEYGAGFAEFLAGFPPCRALPYLPDVARLEWALNTAYHAADATPPDARLLAARLAALPAGARGRVAFSFHPSVHYLASPYPVDLIWHANQDGEKSDALVDLDSGRAHLEIRRADDDAVFRPLPPAEWTLRAALAAGRSLEDAGGLALEMDARLALSSAIAALLSEKILIDATLTPLTREPLT